MTARPPIDVVVPFGGAGFPVDRFAALELGDDDTFTIVDNRPAGDAAPIPVAGRLRVVAAPERQSSYYARNRGAAAGSAPWILFIDADVRPPADLLDAYFAGAPGERAGLLAGGIRDEAGEGPVAARVTAHASLGQENTLERGYAQTANLAVRREAFEAVGGFTDDIRSGGDADLCFRIARAGWALESRPDAAVGHVNRATLRSLAGQQARQGAGAAWLGAGGRAGGGAGGGGRGGGGGAPGAPPRRGRYARWPCPSCARPRPSTAPGSSGRPPSCSSSSAAGCPTARPRGGDAGPRSG